MSSADRGRQSGTSAEGGRQRGRGRGRGEMCHSSPEGRPVAPGTAQARSCPYDVSRAPIVTRCGERDAAAVKRAGPAADALMRAARAACYACDARRIM